VRILDPSVVVRADVGELARLLGPSRQVRGREAVAKQAMAFRRLAPGARHAIVNGTAGLVVLDGDRPYAVLGFAFDNDAIVEIDILADPERLARLDLAAFA
jgi:hypothetical protein